VLVLVVLFMVVGFGMLVVASMTGTVVWGWVSVAVSVLAAVILIFDWRRKWATISDRAPIDLTAYAPSSTADSPTVALPSALHGALSDDRPPDDDRSDADARPGADADAEEVPPGPAEDAVVAELDDEVLVIDEQPHYHVAGCRSLTGHETIALRAEEAVQLEFAPCEVCRPVRVLAGTRAMAQGAPGAGA
jgi:hypothetical protein